MNRIKHRYGLTCKAEEKEEEKRRILFKMHLTEQQKIDKITELFEQAQAIEVTEEDRKISDDFIQSMLNDPRNQEPWPDDEVIMKGVEMIIKKHGLLKQDD